MSEMDEAGEEVAEDVGAKLISGLLSDPDAFGLADVEDAADDAADDAASGSTVAGATGGGGTGGGGAGGGGFKTVQENDAGRFGDLSPGTPGDDLTPHHMPQAAAGYTSRDDGGAIVMKSDDHALTRTYGAKGAATKVSEAGLPFETVLQRDIDDLRQIGQNKYGDPAHFDPGIEKLLKYYRSIGMLKASAP
jgi:hypothetical protein